MTWRLRASEEQRVLIDATLGSCRFCDGEEDGCAMTGVAIRSLKGSGNPVIIVVCLADSSRTMLQLFDPAVSASSPAMLITGSYFIDWSMHGEDTLLIEWDGPEQTIPGCDVQSDTAFGMAPVQNRLLLDSPCYRQQHALE